MGMSETKDRWTGTLTVTYGDGGVHGCLGCRRVGTPAEIAEHVLTCPQHPIGRLAAERDALLARLAEREPISAAEFARFVQEAREQRERADVLESENGRLRSTVRRVIGFMEDAPELWGNPAAETAIDRLRRAAAQPPAAGTEGTQ